MGDGRMDVCVVGEGGESEDVGCFRSRVYGVSVGAGVFWGGGIGQMWVH